MNWFGRLFLKAAGFPVSRSLSLTDPSGWAWWGDRTYSGKNVDDTSALGVPTVFACARVLAETIASLPWGLFERDDQGNAERVEDHPLADLLLSPNMDQTSVEFREAFMTNLALRGNGYNVIERAGSRLTALKPLPASAVEPKQEKSGRIYYEANENGDTRKYERERMWHLKIFSVNGYVGLSPIGYARESMGLSLAQQEVAGKLFANGMHSSMIITAPDWIPNDKRALAREKLRQEYQGLQNAGDPMLLEGGMKAEKGIMPFVDAQFVQLMGMGVDEICRIYRVPPHMVAKLDHATFSNIEQQSLDFVIHTILPYIRRIEDSMSKWLLDAKDRRRLFVRFNVEGLLRADSAARAALYSIMLQNGVLSRNEVRALENRNQVAAEGMDDYTVQSNMALIDQIATLVAQKQQPQQPPQVTQ